jgi:hypothetical protein
MDLIFRLTVVPSTPETFDIVSSTVDLAARKNLAQISKVLTQIASGSLFGEDSPIYFPMNDFVRKAILQMSTWLVEGITSLFVASVLELIWKHSCKCP